ncbi:30S ribosomal protein S18 [Candidatus Beckwithbacteria bacterium]|nr:30S ribosomal protein S18 [Candidatus Beckwithbacteria bacterium]
MQKKRKPRKLPPVKTNDPFVKAGTQPTYKQPEELAPYLSDRGKIMPKSRTGLTAKTQRRLAREVKRARHLALLPFVSGQR